MKRKLLSVFFASVFMVSIAALSGCSQGSSAAQASSSSTSASSETPQSTPDLLAQIRAKGEIVIATEGTWAPWTYHDESDKLVGYDVEVAQKVAEKLGVKASFVEGEWDGLLAGLAAGRYDIMANGVEITAERGEKYDFSEPYAYIRTAIIVSGDNSEINSFEDLRGKQTANTLASTYATLAEGYGAVATGVDDLNQTIELLLAGRVDATLNAEVTYYDYMKAHPDANLRIATLTEAAAQVSMPVRKGEEAATLLEAVNVAIDELRASGELEALSTKYFGSDISSMDTQPSSEAEASEPLPASEATVSVAPMAALAASPQEEASQAPAALQIRVRGNGQTVIFQLNDSTAAKALYAQLPLSIGVENYASNEKIFYPPEKLDTNDTPLVENASTGTLGYYAPWGDVVLFYASGSSDSGLYSLGSAVSGAEQIASLSGTIEIDVSAAE